MIAENQKDKVVRISSVLVGMFLGVVLSVVTSASVLAGVKIVNPAHGLAKIKGEDVSYYYL